MYVYLYYMRTSAVSTIELCKNYHLQFNITCLSRKFNRIKIEH